MPLQHFLWSIFDFLSFLYEKASHVSSYIDLSQLSSYKSILVLTHACSTCKMPRDDLWKRSMQKCSNMACTHDTHKKLNFLHDRELALAYPSWTPWILLHVHSYSMQGELCLVNRNDGTEHMFVLRGVAKKPLAQEHVVLHTQAKTRWTQ